MKERSAARLVAALLLKIEGEDCLEPLCNLVPKSHFNYIETDSSRTAVRIDALIEAQADRSIEMLEIGRPGRVAGTRELTIKRVPYIAAYETTGEAVRTLCVLHGAQFWPDRF